MATFNNRYAIAFLPNFDASALGKMRLTGLKIITIFMVMEASIAEAKKRFCELVDVAEKGETVVILRHGRPAAQLTPISIRRKRQRVAVDDPRLYKGINLNEPILDEI